MIRIRKIGDGGDTKEFLRGQQMDERDEQRRRDKKAQQDVILEMIHHAGSDFRPPAFGAPRCDP